ncbi:MAG: hydantoinase/oxoprolinase family protein [Burkholderiales bacterium]
MPDCAIGWDLGGAHLKVALVDGAGRVCKAMQLPCPLWQGLQHLDSAVAQALGELNQPAALHALTMTGELADIFPNRTAGVTALVEAMNGKLPQASLQVYAGRSGFVTPAQAKQHVGEVASANWLATAEFAAQQVRQALLMDIGSTTTDLVLLNSGKVHARGWNDHQRMACDELIYSGVVRTPVMAVAVRVPFAGEWQGLMAEQFATMADVYRLTGELPEGADQLPAANGGGKTMQDSARRLAHMLGRDLESVPLSSWQQLAGYIADLQQQRFHEACSRLFSLGLAGEEAPLIGTGIGRFLVKKLAARYARPYLDFSGLVESSLSDRQWIDACAPAVAVALLALREKTD